MSVLDRLWRIARAEAVAVARRARDLAQGKHATDSPDATDAPKDDLRDPPRGPERPSPRTTPSQDPTLAGHYAALKLPYGAGLDEVKSAYRKAMREYHPDRHGSDPRRSEAATRVTQHLTESYQALKDHLSR